MAFLVSNFLNTDCGPPGYGVYIYTSDTDNRKTVTTPGYINNLTHSQNLAVGDMIFCVGAQGRYTIEVTAIASDGAVTVKDHMTVTEGNSEGYIYLRGDKNTDESLRLFPDTQTGDNFEFQVRKSGVWNDTGIQIAASTIHLARDLEISGAGPWIMSEDLIENIRSLTPHVEFTDVAGSVRLPRTPKVTPLVPNFPVHPVITGELIISPTNPIQNISLPTTVDLLVKDVTFNATRQATGNLVIEGRRDSFTGPIFFRQTYPASQFSPGNVLTEFDGMWNIQAGQNFYTTYSVDEAGGEVYLGGDVANNRPFLLSNVYAVIEEQIMTMETGLSDVLTSVKDGTVVSDVNGDIITRGSRVA